MAATGGAIEEGPREEPTEGDGAAGAATGGTEKKTGEPTQEEEIISEKGGQEEKEKRSISSNQTIFVEGSRDHSTAPWRQARGRTERLERTRTRSRSRTRRKERGSSYKTINYDDGDTAFTIKFKPKTSRR